MSLTLLEFKENGDDRKEAARNMNLGLRREDKQMVS